MHAERGFTEPHWHSYVILLLRHHTQRLRWRVYIWNRIKIHLSDGALAAATNQLARGGRSLRHVGAHRRVLPDPHID